VFHFGGYTHRYDGQERGTSIDEHQLWSSITGRLVVFDHPGEEPPGPIIEEQPSDLTIKRKHNLKGKINKKER
jgi:hypothetical protein